MFTEQTGRTSEADALASHGLTAAPHASRFVEANGLKLHYLDYGTAGRPPMLCLHGGAVNAHWFDLVAGAFTENFHVHALDQRGHGDSQWADPPDYGYEAYASDVGAVIDRLGLKDVVLMGHSTGGVVALVYAAMNPKRVSRLVLIDSTLQVTPERVARLHGIGNREGSHYATHDEFLSRFKLRPDGTQAVRPVIEYLAQRGGRQGPDGRWRHKFDRNVYAKRPLIDIPPYWSRIDIPVLLVKGSLSDRMTPEIISDIRSRAPQVEFAEVSGSDHHVTLDNPQGFIEAVQSFLTRG